MQRFSSFPEIDGFGGTTASSTSKDIVITGKTFEDLEELDNSVGEIERCRSVTETFKVHALS